MIGEDEDALICDLAETYHIYNYRGLSPSLVATLSVGLRADSRIKMKLAKQEITAELTLQAAICDRLSYIVWLLGGADKSKKPESILDVLSKRNKNNVVAFTSSESFEEKRRAIIAKIEKGGK